MNDDDLKTQLHEMHKKVNLNPDQAQTFVGKKIWSKVFANDGISRQQKVITPRQRIK